MYFNQTSYTQPLGALVVPFGVPELWPTFSVCPSVRPIGFCVQSISPILLDGFQPNFIHTTFYTASLAVSNILVLVHFRCIFSKTSEWIPTKLNKYSLPLILPFGVHILKWPTFHGENSSCKIF